MPHRAVSLAIKFPLFILALLLAVIWGMTCYFNSVLKRDLERLLSTQQFSAASVIAEGIDQEIRLRARTLNELSQAVSKQNLLAAPEQLKAFLRDNLALDVLFNGGLLMLGPDDRQIADTLRTPGSMDRNFADRDYFATLARRASVIGMPQLGNLSGRSLIVMSAPVADASGRITGVLAGITYLDADNFMGRVVDHYGGEYDDVLVIDPISGRFVTATDSSRVFQPIPAPGVNRMHDRYMAGYEGSGIAVNSRGVEYLSSSRRVPTAGWFAVVALPTAQAFAPVTARQKATLGVALALSLVASLLAVLVTRRWLKPLRTATLTLREMTLGRRPLAALPITTRDEVGELVEGCNQLQIRIGENERLLREHRSRLETALDTARMRFIEWPLTAAEPVAEALLALVCSDERQRVADELARDMAVHGKFLTEFHGSEPGATTCFMVRGQVIEQADGRQAIAIVWDSTEFKAAELAFYESEERFEAIIDSLNDAVLLHDGQTGAVLFANARASELYGCGREMFRHFAISDLCACDPPQWPEPGWTPSASDAALDSRHLAQASVLALQSEPQFFECRARSIDGSRLFWVDIYMRAAMIGEVRRLVTVIRDIDDRKRAEDALRQSEERYRTLLDLSPEAIFMHCNGVMTMANYSALRLFGAEREEQVLGLPWTDRVHPEFHSLARQRARAMQEAGSPLVLPATEQRYLRVDGSTIEVEVTSRAIRLTEGWTVLSVARDISARKAAEARLTALLVEREALLDSALVGICLLKNRIIMQCNRRFEELFGYGQDEMLGHRTDILYPTAEFYEAIGERAYSTLMRGGTYMEEVQFMRRDSSRFWGYLHGKALDIRNPRAGSAWVIDDLTGAKRAQERLQLAASVFENAIEGIMITDTHRAIVAVNHAFTEVTGYTVEEVIGKNPNLLNSGRQDPAFYRAMWTALEREGKWRGEIWNRRKNGEVYPELLSISVVRDEEGSTTHYVGVFSDISLQKQAEQQLSFLAHHDPLTELPNRILFNDRLNHAICRAARDNTELAVLFLDLDRFKSVNDTLGHHLGDQLLRLVAGELRKAVRAGDTLARLGGDEFTLLVEDLDGPLNIVPVAEKLLGIFARSFVLAEYELYISASIGVAFYPTDGQEAHDLVKNADAAMYQAKAKGRNNYHYYAKELTAHAAERLQLETRLRRSIQLQELVVYFQPQVELSTGALVGAEALVRWRHPELGLVPPAKFISLAEEIGFIAALGEWVLREACSRMMAWRAAGYGLPKLSVNLSIKQFERGDMVSRIADILAESGLPAGCLEMEITESFIAKADDTVRFIDSLRALGVRLSVDDFGTGYSSLMYLKKLPIQTLKIDRSFVMDIGRDINNEAIIRTIIALAKNLDLAVVAEGVETAVQVTFLLSEGCQFGQGYYFDKPLPESEFVERWLSHPQTDRLAALQSFTEQAAHRQRTGYDHH